MLQLTPEQRDYKERTLAQLVANQQQLEADLAGESQSEEAKRLQDQLDDIEAHISRLQDELAGDVIFHEPIADEIFKQATQALAKGKFYLAKKHITRLEMIEPFYPGLDRVKEEAETGRVTRRTRSIAQGTATAYPGMALIPAPARSLPAVYPAQSPLVAAPAEPPVRERPEEPKSRMAQIFQFHIVMSCLVVLLISCAVFGVAGMTILEFLVEGG
jgi:hypothetical protein